VSENELIFVSPEVQRRRFLARLDEARDERATVDFLARMRGEAPVPGAAVAGAIGQMQAVDATEEITRTRCHNIVDRWLAEQDGTLGDAAPVRELQEILGTRHAAVRSQMLDSQDRVRARHLETERAKSALQRRVDELERENVSLRSQVDRSFEAIAEQAHPSHTSYR